MGVTGLDFPAANRKGSITLMLLKGCFSVEEAHRAHKNLHPQFPESPQVSLPGLAGEDSKPSPFLMNNFQEKQSAKGLGTSLKSHLAAGSGTQGPVGPACVLSGSACTAKSVLAWSPQLSLGQNCSGFVFSSFPQYMFF